jgi:hypothetical protein
MLFVVGHAVCVYILCCVTGCYTELIETKIRIICLFLVETLTDKFYRIYLIILDERLNHLIMC